MEGQEQIHGAEEADKSVQMKSPCGPSASLSRTLNLKQPQTMFLL